MLGAVLAPASVRRTQAEQPARARLFDAPSGATKPPPAESRPAAVAGVPRRSALCVGLFFLFFYAIPYSRAL
ncbi:MAG: hypothetical protein ACLUNO_00535 [Oscillospiraceae bacterium]